MYAVVSVAERNLRRWKLFDVKNGPLAELTMNAS